MSPTTSAMLMIFVALLISLAAEVSPFPFESSPTLVLVRRTEPYFPDTPRSCPICEADYGSIQHCAEAAPVLANFSMIIFNPGAFVDVIQCACTETFQSVFPQCVDCFQRTDQADVINTDDLPSVISGMKQVCALGSSLLGNVNSTNGETQTATTSAESVAASSNNADPPLFGAGNVLAAVTVVAIIVLSYLGVF